MTAELSNLADLRALRAQRNRTPPPTDTRIEVHIENSHRARAASEAEEALIASGAQFYRQGARVVRPMRETIKVAGGGEGETLRISQVNIHALMSAWESVAVFKKYDGRAEDFLPTDCPNLIAEEYLARDGNWRLPYLLGIVTAPTIRPDGSLLDARGYDASTGLLYEPNGTIYPAISAAPSRDDALAALAYLKEPIALYPFVLPEHRSVALSGMLTAIVRRALPTAPLHGFTAPAAGSGKSALVDIAAIMATGERAAVTTSGRGRDGDVELEKRLTASMLAGDAVLSIDNLEGPLGGELLCTLMTQPKAKLRILGKSTNVDVPVTTAFFATANNLVVLGDMTRRALVGALDPGVERPELRAFSFDPIQMALENRGKLVAAALTVIRAWVCSGGDYSTAPLGSFERWSYMVREPLLWLGEPDPCAVMDSVRKSDPRLAKLKLVMDAWEAHFGSSPTTVREVCDACQERDAVRVQDERSGDWHERPGHSFLYRELRDAIMTTTDDRDPQPINGSKLSWWLRKNVGRTVGVRRFVELDDEGKYSKWHLECAKERYAGAAADDEIPF